MTDSPATGGKNTRAEIAAVALRVIARKGVAGASLRQVAAELGQTTGVLTHHFRDRADLLEHAFSTAAVGIREQAMPVLGEDPAESLRRIALALVVDGDGDVAAASAALHLLAHALPAPLARARQRELRDHLRNELRWSLEALRAAGRLPQAHDPDRESQRLVCLMEGLRIQTLLDPLAHPPDTQRSLILEQVARIGVG